MQMLRHSQMDPAGSCPRHHLHSSCICQAKSDDTQHLDSKRPVLHSKAAVVGKLAVIVVLWTEISTGCDICNQSLLFSWVFPCDSQQREGHVKPKLSITVQ